MILSIIMISIPEREEHYRVLKRKVQKQIEDLHETHPTLGRVEIVSIVSPKFNDGGGSIGTKRQLGLLASKGEYVCWLDDDDDIAPGYVEELVRMANKGADVCTFNNISKFHNFWMVVKMHLSHKLDDQARPGIIQRRPYHICAFRRGVLDGVTFPDANWDEDTGFIAQALKNCRTFAHTDAILHEYRRIEVSYASK
jgi:glycosyltransferase involved in cell wall biosynthesis